MGFKAELKGNKAYKLHGNGQYAEAKKLYAEAYADGMINPRHILGYTVLLLRDGEYAKAREILVALSKQPQRDDVTIQLYVNYAAAVFRMGELDKAIRHLEGQHRKTPTGLIYQTLGYLYVEKYDLEKKPDFDALEAAERAAAEAAQAEEAPAEAEAPAEEAAQADAEPQQAEVKKSAREAWDEGVAKASAFIDESLEYDDEDSVCLDNKAQFLYRVLGDKAGAKTWFEKARKVKENQIDTLWFLSRYDLEAGDTAAAKEKLEKLRTSRFSPLNYCNKDMVEKALAAL